MKKQLHNEKQAELRKNKVGDIHMKNGIKGKLGAKLIAMFLFVISAVVLAGSCLAVMYLIEEDAFFDNGQRLSTDIRESCLRNKLVDITEDISHWGTFGSPALISDMTESEDSKDEDSDVVLSWGPSVGHESEDSKSQQQNLPISKEDFGEAAGWLTTNYSKHKSNVSISVYNSADELIYNNFAPYDRYTGDSTQNSKKIQVERYAAVGTPVSVQFATAEERDDYIDSCMQNGYLDFTEEEIYISGVPEEHSYIYKLTGVFTEKITQTLNVQCSIPHELTVQDDIYTRIHKIETLVDMKYALIILAIVGALIMITTFIFIVCSAGYSERFEGIHLTLFDKAPLELHLGCMAAIAGVILWLFFDVCYAIEIWMAIALLLASVAVAALAFIIFVNTFSARCKAGKLFHYTIVFGSIILLFRGLKYLFSNMKYSWKAAIIFVAASVYDLFFVVILISSPSELALAMWLLGKLVLGAALIIYAIGFGRIREGCKKLSEGKTDFVLRDTYLPPDLKSLAGDLNSIGNGIQLAVDERTRSERLKTELITNVSHDLKTPLTSIVNYVDILSKEDIKPDSAKEYVEVLVRQSQRMKKLIDDLVEASKASSGAIAVNAQRLDMSLLITQAVTEFEERLERSKLTPITMLSDVPVRVMVDGRLMWRVFDNLLGNICKYAQPETRVYISEIIIGDKVVVTFKNVSKYALNISSEELMERFVRGDSSRHTEGSGLGLSIARSLCALQNVGFGISIDGDLFKAQLTFDRLPSLPEDTLPVISENEETPMESASPAEQPTPDSQQAPAPQPAPAAAAGIPPEVSEEAKAMVPNPPGNNPDEATKAE